MEFFYPKPNVLGIDKIHMATPSEQSVSFFCVTFWRFFPLKERFATWCFFSMIDGRNWLPIQEKRVEAALTHFTIKVDVFAFGFIANMILLKFEARLRKLFNKMKVLD